MNSYPIEELANRFSCQGLLFWGKFQWIGEEPWNIGHFLLYGRNVWVQIRLSEVVAYKFGSDILLWCKDTKEKYMEGNVTVNVECQVGLGMSYSSYPLPAGHAPGLTHVPAGPDHARDPGRAPGPGTRGLAPGPGPGRAPNPVLSQGHVPRKCHQPSRGVLV